MGRTSDRITTSMHYSQMTDRVPESAMSVKSGRVEAEHKTDHLGRIRPVPTVRGLRHQKLFCEYIIHIYF